MKLQTLFFIALLLGTSVSTMTGCKDKKGCTDPYSDNFDPDAVEDDGSCTYTSYNLSGIVSEPKTLINRIDDPNLPDYYLVGELDVQADINVEPGVIVMCQANTSILVRDNGSLRAKGTASDGIRFIGENAVAGHWNGISISSPSSNNVMDHVEILHAGGNNVNFTGSVYVDADGRLSFTNSSIDQSGDDGLVLGWQEAVLADFSANRFANCNGFPVTMYLSQVPQIDGASVFDASNTQNYIQVGPSVNTNPFTWRRAQIPYLVISKWFEVAEAKADVTIEAGTDIRFDDGCCLNFEGVVTAIGTANSKIRFAGRVATQGFGGFVQFDTPGNTLSYCEFANMGQVGLGGYDGSIYLNDGAAIDMSNSSVTGSATWGIYQYFSGIYNDGGGNSFSNNAYGDVGP